jgi:leucyl aminopeptidase
MHIDVSANQHVGSCQSLVFPVAGPKHLQLLIGRFPDLFSGLSAYLQADFKGDFSEIHPFYAQGIRIFLVGLGEKPKFGDLLKAFRGFGIKCKHKMGQSLAVQLHVLPEEQKDMGTWIEAAINGLVLSTYQLGKFKSDPPEIHPLRSEAGRIELLLPAEATAMAQTAIQRALAFSYTQLEIFDLVNAPANHLTPNILAAWAKKSGATHGYDVKILDKEALTQQGLQALLAVSQGSAEPPALVVMEYKGAELPAHTPVLALVGKGVTFDTGGLSIKPSSNMHLMKSDMGGAAAVLGALEVAAKLQLPVHLIGIIPTTENCVDAHSFKPGDIIGSYSGKTIEVIDTDAEGRLILADGIAYAIKNFAPDVLIDLATLTGSAVRTFGYHAAALFSNNKDLVRQLENLGETTGERVWQLPLWEVYKEDIKSDIADVKNFSGKPVAGAISAAKFLEFFTDNHPAWAHLDIAGVAFSETDYSPHKSASGFGIRLLVTYLQEITQPEKIS